MSGGRTPTIPDPGQAVTPTADVAELLRRNRDDRAIAARTAIMFGDQRWTHRQFVDESIRWANLFRARLPAGRPPHVGVLLDNTPDYLFALGGAALCGAAVIGLNHTRQGENLLRDITHTDIGLVVTEPRHLSRLAPIVDQTSLDGQQLLVSRRYEEDDVDAVPGVGVGIDDALGEVSVDDVVEDIDPTTPWVLVFTSGTSSAPKAVICSQKRILTTGTRLGIAMELGPDDVGYICMPLFHSNALMVGWAPSLVQGCAVGLARKFSASGWLPDIRRYHSTYFNYTGKPLAYLLSTPERDDDADNTLRIAYGNEGSPEVVDSFARRFGLRVVDVFGATEGGISLRRDVPAKPGAMGVAGPEISIVGDDGNELAAAEFDDEGRLLNADACVGEIVNTVGAGPFEGYYNNPEATEKTLRNGWYWSGDLGYLDADRNLYFAGRTADWLRVDGENFPAGPIEDALSRHPDVVSVAVYGVPDAQAGDQVMAAVVLASGATFDPSGFAEWVDALSDVGPKWRPRFVRILSEMPTTGTNKIVKRTLVHQKFRRDRIGDDELFVRERGDRDYRVFTPEDERLLRDAFVGFRREQFWDL